MENKLNAKLDAIISEINEIKSDQRSIKKELKEIKDGTKTSVRKARDACYLLEKKVIFTVWDTVLYFH